MAFIAPDAPEVTDEETPTPQLPVTPTAAPATGGFVAPDTDYENAIQALVKDKEYDPLHDAIESTKIGDMDGYLDRYKQAQEVAFRRKQAPWTADDYRAIPGAVVSGGWHFIKNFGGGLGTMAANAVTAATDESDANRDRAKTEMAAAAQLAEANAGNFLSKIFGNYAHTSDDQVEDPRAFFNTHFNQLVEDERRRRKLASGQVDEKGIAAGIFKDVAKAAGEPNAMLSESFRSPQELALAGAPVDPEAIEQMATPADPTNLIPLHVPGGAELANAVGGRALNLAGKAIEHPANVAARVAESNLVRHAAPAAVILNPLVAAKAAAAYALTKGAQGFGKFVSNAGRELYDAKFVTPEAADAIAGLQKGWDSKLASMLDPKANLAAGRRTARKVLQGGVTAPLAFAPIAAAASDNPEEFASMLGTAGFLGAFSGAGRLGGDHNQIVDQYQKDLIKRGDEFRYGNEALDAAHERAIQQADPDTANTVNAYRGFLEGLTGENGEQVQVYYLDPEGYNSALVQEGNPVNPDGSARDINTRGFASQDGSRIYLNGSKAGAGETAGHEAGHIADVLARITAPKLAGQMRLAIANKLYDGNGAPTPQFQKFIDTYASRLAGKNATPEELQAVKDRTNFDGEFIAETARRLLAGQPVAKFGLPPSLRQSILDGAKDYLHQTWGLNLGPFNGQVVAQVNRKTRDLLYNLGRLKHEGMPETGDQPAAPAEPRGGEFPGEEVAPAPGEAPAASAAPAQGFVAPAEATEVMRAGIPQANIDAARDAHMQFPAEPQTVRANVKRGISGKSKDKVADERGKEFDEIAEGYLKALEDQGLEGNPDTFYHDALLWHLQQDAPAPVQEPALIGSPNEANPKESAPESATPASEVPPPAVPEAPPVQPEAAPSLPTHSQTQVGEITRQAEEAAAKSPEYQRARKNKGEILRKAKIRALLDALPEESSGLRVRTDEFGEEKIDGNLDFDNPVHQELARLANLNDHAREVVTLLQESKGKHVFLDYKSAEKPGAETGEGLDFTQEQRAKELENSPAEERAQGSGKVTVQKGKSFVPLKTTMSKDGKIGVLGFSLDKVLNNTRHILDAMKEQKIPSGYDTLSGPELDKTLQSDFIAMTENHANGYKGDGSGPMEQFADTGGPQASQDFVPTEIPKDRFDVLNMALHNETALGVKSSKASTQAKAKEAVNLAELNEGFLDPQSGEVNSLRKQLKDGGFNPKLVLESPFEKLRPELVAGVKTSAEGQSIVRPSGIDVDVAEMGKQLPQGKFTAAGFMPDTGTVDSIKSNPVKDAAEENNTRYDKFDPLTGKHQLTLLDNRSTIYVDKDATPEQVKQAIEKKRTEYEGDQIDTPEKLEAFLRKQGAFMPDTPEFKKWFGDSKVVDKDGKPKKVFHGGSFNVKDGDGVFNSWTHFGTKESAMDRIGGKVGDDLANSIELFENEDGTWGYEIDGQGDEEKSYSTKEKADDAARMEAINIASDMEVDDHNANITEAYLSLKNPVRLHDLGTWGLEAVIRDLPKEAKLTPEEREHVGELTRSGKQGDDWKELTNILKSKGYDGVVYKNEIEDKGKDSYIVFDPNQVKSATHNNGEFDASNPDIRFMPDTEVPPMYSQLKRVVDQKIKGRVSPEQLRATLKNNGVKSEELEWTLGDLLSSGKKSITPEEINKAIKENSVELREIVKSTEQEPEDIKVSPDDFHWTERIAENDRRGADFDDDTVLYFGRHPEEDTAFVITPVKEDEKPYLAHDDTEYMLRRDWGDPFEASSIEEAKDIAADYVRRNLEDRRRDDEESGRAGNTQFGHYQLPGGENYREFNYTVPTNIKKPSTEGWTAVLSGYGPGKKFGIYTVYDSHGDIITEGMSGYTEAEAIESAAEREGKQEIYKVPGPHQYGDEADINRVFHIRTNDRDVGDQSMLFLEELQSDLHQTGREKGYKQKPKHTNRLAEIRQEIKAIESRMDEMDTPEAAAVRTKEDLKERQSLYQQVSRLRVEATRLREEDTNSQAVPDLPFKGETWKRLGLRKAIELAVKEGKDRIGWTTGEQQAERYDLSKHLSMVQAVRSGANDSANVRAYDKNGNSVFSKQVPLSELPDTIGKEFAEKIAAQEPGEESIYEGLDLKVGGEGMKGFYDKELVNIANDLGKRYGARVEKAQIDDPMLKAWVFEEGGKYVVKNKRDGADPNAKVLGEFDNAHDAMMFAHEKKGTEIWSLPITDKMREAIQKEGQPMFMPDTEEKNLVAVHNLSTDNLRHVLHLGGIPVPSLAAVRTDISKFDNFGDITLVAGKDLADPKGNAGTKWFNADVYSPRYPRTKIIFKKPSKATDVFRPYMEELKDHFAPGENDYPWRASTITDSIEDRGFRETMYRDAAQYAYLRANGLMEKPAPGKTMREISDEVYSKARPIQDKIPDWIKKTIEDAGVDYSDKIFKGYSNSGNPTYIDHTLDNVVKYLKREGIRDKEGFNYGVPSIRANMAKQYRSLEVMGKDRNKILPKDQMTPLKEVSSDEFSALADEVNDLRVNKAEGFGMLDAISDDFKALAQGGQSNWTHLREMYGDNYQRFREKAQPFLDKLKNMETEYFEGKTPKAVTLQEFEGAVVPEDTDPELIHQLQRRGLEVKKYPKSDSNARRAAVKEIAESRKVNFMPDHEEVAGNAKTGEPIEFNFIRRKASATGMLGKPDKDSPFDRGYEPSGRYMMAAPDRHDGGSHIETGTVKFENPLVMEVGTYGTPSSWKRKLSEQYDSKTGKALSRALIDDGYDGVITTFKDSKGVSRSSEILDLTTFDESKAKFMPESPDSIKSNRGFDDVKFDPEDDKKPLDGLEVDQPD